MTDISTSLEDTKKIAEKFLALCTPLSEKACVVGLHGDLGAGKTAFTQAVAKMLGIQDIVTSPTFVIEKIYKLEHKDFDHLIHIDAYRLESGSELQNLGWQEIITNPKNLIFLEWPEKVADILPSDIKSIHFKVVDEHSREISF